MIKFFYFISVLAGSFLLTVGGLTGTGLANSWVFIIIFYDTYYRRDPFSLCVTDRGGLCLIRGSRKLIFLFLLFTTNLYPLKSSPLKNISRSKFDFLPIYFLDLVRDILVVRRSILVRFYCWSRTYNLIHVFVLLFIAIIWKRLVG